MGLKRLLGMEVRASVPTKAETGDSEPEEPEEGEQMSPEEERGAVDDLEDHNRPENPVDKMERKGLEE